jgi:LAS superfamily LD-carboxypeptidase LdcB
MSSTTRKIRRNILQAVTGDRSFRNRINPSFKDNPKKHAEARKKFYQKVDQAAKNLAGLTT